MRAIQRVLVHPDGLNKNLTLPYQMTIDEVAKALQQVYDIIRLLD